MAAATTTPLKPVSTSMAPADGLVPNETSPAPTMGAASTPTTTGAPTGIIANAMAAGLPPDSQGDPSTMTPEGVASTKPPVAAANSGLPPDSQGDPSTMTPEGRATTSASPYVPNGKTFGAPTPPTPPPPPPPPPPPAAPAASAATTVTPAVTASAPAPVQITPKTANTSTVDMGSLERAVSGNATASQWKVDDNQTVQYHLNNILNANGPLMQRAAALANQASNDRGLVNSSLGVGAGVTAMTDKALEIAKPDAATYAAAASQNAQEGTKVSIANANNATSTSQFNAGQTNETQRFNTGESNTTSRFNTGQENAAAQFNADATNTTNRFNVGEANTTSRFNTEQQGLNSRFAQEQAGINSRFADEQKGLNDRFYSGQASDTDRLKMQLDAQKDMQEKGFVHSDAAQKYALDVQQAMQTSDQANKIQLQTMSGQVQQQIAAFEAKYRTTMQASSSMAASYQQYITSATNITLDPNLDAASKQAMLKQLGDTYDGMFQMQKTITGLDLGKLLPGSTITGSTISGNANENPAATGGSAPDPNRGLGSSTDGP